MRHDNGSGSPGVYGGSFAFRHQLPHPITAGQASGRSGSVGVLTLVFHTQEAFLGPLAALGSMLLFPTPWAHLAAVYTAATLANAMPKAETAEATLHHIVPAHPGIALSYPHGWRARLQHYGRKPPSHLYSGHLRPFCSSIKTSPLRVQRMLLMLPSSAAAASFIIFTTAA